MKPENFEKFFELFRKGHFKEIQGESFTKEQYDILYEYIRRRMKDLDYTLFLMVKRKMQLHDWKERVLDTRVEKKEYRRYD